MENLNFGQLMEVYYSARRKRTLGIIFTSIAAVHFYLLYLLLLAGIRLRGVEAMLVFISLPFFSVGIPFLIKGIIGTIKANRQISLLKAAQQKAAPTVVSAPVVAAPKVEEKVEAAPVVEVKPEPEAQPVEEPKTEEPKAAEPEAPKTTGFVDIDLEKYAPLDAGVSYNPTKDYKFHRADGFVGSVPQTFVNRTFPKCPICCSDKPEWTIAQHNQMSWKGNLYLFKCSHCDGIISMSMPDVTTLGNGGAGVASNPTVGLTNLMVKASSGKEAGAVYAVIESVGKSGVSPICQGKEFKLEQLQEMFSRM
ncbi:MAG: hypothetical protein IKJ50_02465 [Clostridia bacterium]|nr:hypothetical protein [Clostridia bacterium]